ncbi:YncE family protein [Nocardia sp. NPDC051570]|uniref:YncE family protein n=1 Tax=Nocardia sp. NPDC051570 TaxID=3364324 RepID=UPI0037B98656
MRGPHGNRPVRRRWPSALVAAALAVPILSGCSSSNQDTTAPAAGAPGVAAVAPATAHPPAGTVLATAPIAAVLSEPASGRVVMLDADGRGVRVLDPATGAVRAVGLPATTSWALGAPGEILLAAGTQVLHLDPAAATVRTTPVDAPVRALTRRPDGTTALALDGGKVEIRTLDDQPQDLKVEIRDTKGNVVRDTVTGLGAIDAIAAAGDALAVLDRDQTTLTQLDLATHRPGLSLRAGQGTVGLISDHFGRLLATDTSGGALLVYTADPLVLRQRFPVGSSPYALAYDRSTETVWVTLTGSNEVVGYDLSKGIPEEVGRFATVRQPNSVTIDERTGEMFVGSATGDGLERIGADQRKRGQ